MSSGHVPPKLPLPFPFSEPSCTVNGLTSRVDRVSAHWGLGQGREKCLQGIWNQALAEGGDPAGWCVCVSQALVCECNEVIRMSSFWATQALQACLYLSISKLRKGLD